MEKVTSDSLQALLAEAKENRAALQFLMGEAMRKKVARESKVNLEGGAATLWESMRKRLGTEGDVTALWYDRGGHPAARVFVRIARWDDPNKLDAATQKPIRWYERTDEGLRACGQQRRVSIGELKANVANVHLCEKPEDFAEYSRGLAPIIAQVKPPYILPAKDAAASEAAEAVAEAATEPKPKPMAKGKGKGHSKKH